MAARPYWSGQIKLALVYLPVQLFTATQRRANVQLHEIYRQTGERIHHQNVTEDGTPVEREDIVKAFIDEHKQYVPLEEEEIRDIKLPSSNILDLVQFVDRETLPVTHFERPYYVMPNGKAGEEIYGVLRQALLDSGKVGLGQLALRGREELCALIPFERGLILETLRYPEELRDPAEFFDDLRTEKLDKDSVALAKELIKRSSKKLELNAFADRYHDALRELIASKAEDREPVYEVEEEKAPKVINLMDALRKSLGGGTGKAKTSSAKRAPASKPKPKEKVPARKSTSRGSVKRRRA